MTSPTRWFLRDSQTGWRNHEKTQQNSADAVAAKIASSIFDRGSASQKTTSPWLKESLGARDTHCITLQYIYALPSRRLRNNNAHLIPTPTQFSSLWISLLQAEGATGTLEVWCVSSWSVWNAWYIHLQGKLHLTIQTIIIQKTVDWLLITSWPRLSLMSPFEIPSASEDRNVSVLPFHGSAINVCLVAEGKRPRGKTSGRPVHTFHMKAGTSPGWTRRCSTIYIIGLSV